MFLTLDSQPLGPNLTQIFSKYLFMDFNILLCESIMFAWQKFLFFLSCLALCAISTIFHPNNRPTD
jgi:hypothetical protein